MLINQLYLIKNRRLPGEINMSVCKNILHYEMRLDRRITN